MVGFSRESRRGAALEYHEDSWLRQAKDQQGLDGSNGPKAHAAAF